MKKLIVNVLAFLPKLVIGIIGFAATLILLGYVTGKTGFRKVFGFLTCEG